MSAELPIALPRMTTDADLACIEAAMQGVAEGEIAVEFGPWLGGLSRTLADRFELHTVDRFLWTSDHAKKAPQYGLAIGDDFAPLLQQNLSDTGRPAVLYKSLFENFSWSGDKIGLIVVDGPKTAPAMKDCLSGVAGYMKSTGSLLIKNGLNPLHTSIATYVERLIAAEVFQLPRQSVSADCNVLHLKPGPNLKMFDSIRSFDPTWQCSATLQRQIDLADDHPYHFVNVVAGIGAAKWDEAYATLSAMRPEAKLAATWTTIDLKPLKTSSNEALVDQLSEVVGFHHRQQQSEELPVDLGDSRATALCGYWVNRRYRDGHAEAYHPDILTKAFEFGYMSWPNKIRQHVYGKDVLDIGCGPGLHGLGYLAVGAKSYLGLDPILLGDRDRAKNLTNKKKQPFGWTPNQMSQAFPQWHASAEAVGDTPLERQFDLCTLHNVTEHLHGLDEIFADIAARLRIGGKILYNHHNFYCWNGHHLPPKAVSNIDLTDPKQLEMLDWKHINYVPEPDHYIARGLNRIKLDELIAITKKYFVIEELVEIPSRRENGLDRLTQEIRAQHPDLSERELATQNLYCVATVAA